MAFLHTTTAPHTLMVPEGWHRLGLEQDNQALVQEAKRLAAASVSHEIPRDRRPLAIEQVRRYVGDALQDAKAQGMLGVTLPVDAYAQGRTMPLSVTDFEYDASDDREGGLTLSMLRAGMLRGGRDSQVIQVTEGLRAVRTLAVDHAPEIEGEVLRARATTLLFAFPLPSHPERWKGIMFSFTVPAHAEETVDRAYIAIADVMIRSFRFVDDGGEQPSRLEERIAELLRQGRAAGPRSRTEVS
jgi:hypothetical protein